MNAIKRVKAAFYLQMAEELRTKYQLKVKVNFDSIDVLKGKFVGSAEFRLANPIRFQTGTISGTRWPFRVRLRC